MKILLASPRGFCAGVNMAIESLDLALDAFGPPVYVYHEIVHNKYVVENFKDKGAVFVDDLNEVPPNSNLLFSAHGVSPEVRNIARQRNLTAIDATCPLVTKVHLEAIRFAREGYTIILIGHEGHDEVIGTMGEAPEAILLVESPEGVDQLKVANDARLAYLTQTTLSVDDANRIIARLKERFPGIEGPPKEDICYATQNRQEAVRILSEEADVCLVLGSQNSSNSQRLRELAAESDIGAYLIDGAADIENDWFRPDDTVLMTAGASAPESVVQECIDYLVQQFTATVEVRTIRAESVPLSTPARIAPIGAVASRRNQHLHVAQRAPHGGVGHKGLFAATCGVAAAGKRNQSPPGPGASRWRRWPVRERRQPGGGLCHPVQRKTPGRRRQ